MGEYRAFFGRFRSFMVLDCPDDEAAIEAAKQLIDSHHIELWQLDRKISTFQSKSK